VRTLESLPSFRGEARFKTWLFGIATHVSEPVFRHRLSAARATMSQAYGGLCHLIN